MVHFMHNDWGEVLASEFDKPYYKELRQFLIHASPTERVIPPMEDIYNALHATSYADTKVVILGQDPYHGQGQAHGLSFSVREGVKPPPSLLNIFKEMEADLGCIRPNHGCLQGWAEARGAFIKHHPHRTRRRTQKSRRTRLGNPYRCHHLRAEARETPMVFILWGAHAQSKCALINQSKHHIIKSPHPSPLSASRGFFGSAPLAAPTPTSKPTALHRLIGVRF